jgi:superkiller protein 3
MADRYTYLPSLGITVAVLWTLHDFARPAASRAAWSAAAGAVLAGLAVATWNQLAVWSSSLTLFHHTIAVAGQGNYLAYNNRGVALFHEGRLDDAIADYQRSLEIFSDYPEANNNLGDALAKKGRREEAIAYYRKAISVAPKLAHAHNNLANALSDEGAIAEAFEHYETALRLKPGDPMMLNNYGAALGMAGRLDDSLARLLEADRINPREPGLQSNLGNALAIMGRVDEAAARFRKAIELDPKDAARAHFNLGVLHFRRGLFAEAVPELRGAIDLTGPTAPGYALLGEALVQLGRVDEGIRYLRESLRIQPDNPQAAAWLADANAGRSPAK